MAVAAFLQLSGPAKANAGLTRGPCFKPSRMCLAGATRGDGRYMAFGEAHGLLKLVCSLAMLVAALVVVAVAWRERGRWY